MNKTIAASIIISLSVSMFFVSVFVFFGITPSVLINNLKAQFVGMYAEVGANPDNMVAQQLKEKEQALSEREASIQEKENQINSLTADKGDNYILYIVLGMGAVMFFLILLNFYFDFRHKKSALAVKENGNMMPSAGSAG